jgi:hypothetical protein
MPALHHDAGISSPYFTLIRPTTVWGICTNHGMQWTSFPAITIPTGVGQFDYTHGVEHHDRPVVVNRSLAAAGAADEF